MHLLSSLPIIAAYLAVLGTVLISQTGPTHRSLVSHEDVDWDS